ncbi:MAG: hypothetical protein GW886_05325 [Rhodobacterales bacterium]|nr:hypothetical protein [Rhodobacterales bacterium]NCT13469.1 hypothetical protein [Rhodobacterales bacterium]
MSLAPCAVVVGSLQEDIVVAAPHRPTAGKAVTASAWRPVFVGKGGIQAAAIVAAHVPCRMMRCLMMRWRVGRKPPERCIFALIAAAEKPTLCGDNTAARRGISSGKATPCVLQDPKPLRMPQGCSPRNRG